MNVVIKGTQFKCKPTTGNLIERKEKQYGEPGEKPLKQRREPNHLYLILKCFVGMEYEVTNYP